MVPYFDYIRRYTDRRVLLVAALTATLLFLHEVVSAYRLSIGRSIRLEPLSTGDWVVFTVGSFLVEPVLLFVSLYYASRHPDERLPMAVLLPTLVVAVVVGCLLGQFVGWRIWRVYTPLSTALQRNMLLPSPLTLLHWQEFATPLVRSFLTALAAVGLAEYRT